MPPVQPVEVLDAGGASLFGMLVVELLDVVVLRIVGGRLRAAGGGAAGVDQPQVLDHLGGGPVALGGQGQERTGERCGEDPVPDGLGLGERAGHVRRQRCHAVVGGGGVVQAHQGEHGDDHVDAVARRGHLDPRGLQQGALDDGVAQCGQRHGGPVALDVPVEVEGDRRALLESVALRLLDGLRRGVEAAGEPEDLRDRAGDAQAGDAVIPPAELDGDIAGVLGAGARTGRLEPGDELTQLVAETIGGKRGEIPGGDIFIGLGTLMGREISQRSQGALMPFAGHLPGGEPLEGAGHLGDGRVRVLDAQRGDARGGAQGDADREAVLLALEVRILVIDPEGGEVEQLPRAAARLLALGLQQAGDGCGVGAARGDLPPCEQGVLRERRASLHAAHGRGGRLTGRGDAFCRARAGRGHGLHLLVGVLVQDAPRTHPTSRRG